MDGGVCRPWSLFSSFAVILLIVFLAGCGAKPGTVTLAFLGDINLGRDVHPSVHSFDYLAKALDKADLAMANLESPLAAELPVNTTGYNLCAPAELAGYLPMWGLDLVSIVNNHSTDCGEYGSMKDMALVEGAGLTPLWAGPPPLYRQVKTLKLAFLAFEDVTTPLDAQVATKFIREAAATGAVVIVSIHWGMEYQSGASDRQKTLAQQFAEAGAAVIWGHHPHVLQPVEWIPNGDRKTLVLYSLGNALFDQGGLADTRQSALALVEVNAEGAQSVRAVPFVIDVNQSRLEAPDADTARKILDQLKIK